MLAREALDVFPSAHWSPFMAPELTVRGVHSLYVLIDLLYIKIFMSVPRYEFIKFLDRFSIFKIPNLSLELTFKFPLEKSKHGRGL